MRKPMSDRNGKCNCFSLDRGSTGVFTGRSLGGAEARRRPKTMLTVIDRQRGGGKDVGSDLRH